MAGTSGGSTPLSRYWTITIECTRDEPMCYASLHDTLIALHSERRIAFAWLHKCNDADVCTRGGTVVVLYVELCGLHVRRTAMLRIINFHSLQENAACELNATLCAHHQHERLRALETAKQQCRCGTHERQTATIGNWRYVITGRRPREGPSVNAPDASSRASRGIEAIAVPVEHDTSIIVDVARAGERAAVVVLCDDVWFADVCSATRRRLRRLDVESTTAQSMIRSVCALASTPIVRLRLHRATHSALLDAVQQCIGAEGEGSELSATLVHLGDVYKWQRDNAEYTGLSDATPIAGVLAHVVRAYQARLCHVLASGECNATDDVCDAVATSIVRSHLRQLGGHFQWSHEHAVVAANRKPLVHQWAVDAFAVAHAINEKQKGELHADAFDIVARVVFPRASREAPAPVDRVTSRMSILFWAADTWVSGRIDNPDVDATAEWSVDALTRAERRAARMAGVHPDVVHAQVFLRTRTTSRE